MGSRLSGDWRRIVLGAALAGLSVLVAVPLARAGQQTEAGLSGTVTDESQGVMPGVTVTVSSPSLQGARDTVTDEQGKYRISPLPIGTYTVVFSLSGFRTVRREEVRLTAGLTARIDVALSVGGVEETITVSGASPVVDVTHTSASTTLTRETLDVIPTARTGYNAILAQAPGVRDTLQALSPTSSPNFRAFGQSNQAYQSIDGVITTSPLLAQTGQYIDGTAFEEAVISTLGHDASVPTRGIALTTVVKSGGNDFHGQGFVGWANQNLSASNLTPELTGARRREARQSPVEGRLERRSWRPRSSRQTVVLGPGALAARQARGAGLLPAEWRPVLHVAACLLSDDKRDLENQQVEHPERHADVDREARQRGRRPSLWRGSGAESSGTTSAPRRRWNGSRSRGTPARCR